MEELAGEVLKEDLNEYKFMAVLVHDDKVRLLSEKGIIALGKTKDDIQEKILEYISRTGEDISDIKIIPYHKIISPNIKVTF